ncbi:MAG: CAP domain-containing protein [Deltaproteobacteria bacterium]|nr:CAP domain-containing protein [Deltaproteobacteria bacterium]
MRPAVFAHVNPDGKDPFDRMEDAGIAFVAAAENIAMGTDGAFDVGDFEDLFMDEPECAQNHRGNILNRDLTHVGIGVHHCGDGNLYVTQDFGTFSFDDIRDDPHEYCEGG